MIPATEDTGLYSERPVFGNQLPITAMVISFSTTCCNYGLKSIISTTLANHISRTSADREVAAQDGTVNYQPAARQESKRN